MTEKAMCLELKDNEIKDNPFDVMLYYSLEMTRDLLFACNRLRNPNIPKGICVDQERLHIRMNKILEQFNKLSLMSDETVNMLKETSYYHQPEEFNKVNDILLLFESSMDTLYTRCVPNRHDKFERIRLGEDSKEYKRLVELRKLIDESEELSKVDTEYLYSLIDVIDYIKYHINRINMSEKSFKEKQKIINKYKLTEDDINYMISYKSRFSNF